MNVTLSGIVMVPEKEWKEYHLQIVPPSQQYMYLPPS